MLYTRSAQYAIRALALLASEPRDNYVPIRDVARSARVPLPFLAKIMQVLARSGLVDSRRGPGGGVRLARAPHAVTLEEIVVAVDGEDSVRECVLGLPHCADTNPCPVHEVWKQVRPTLRRQLHDRSLADIGPGKAPKRLRSRRP